MRTRVRLKNAALIGVAVLLEVALLLTVLFFLLPRETPKDPSPGTPPIQMEGPASPVPPNKFGPEDFEMQGEYLACVAGKSELGVDVSTHQQDIDWQQVKSAGVAFAMIRAGYRGYGQVGNMLADENAQTNYEGAKNAGLKTGAYFFSQATNVEEAREEARFLLEIIDGWKIDMPVVYDWERVDWVETSRTKDVSVETVIECSKAFCQEIARAGYRPMVYFNLNLAETEGYLEALLGYDMWLAMYDTTMDYPHAIDMWQYTDSGSVPGISTDVDINLYFPE